MSNAPVKKTSGLRPADRYDSAGIPANPQSDDRKQVEMSAREIMLNSLKMQFQHKYTLKTTGQVVDCSAGNDNDSGRCQEAVQLCVGD